MILIYIKVYIFNNNIFVVFIIKLIFNIVNINFYILIILFLIIFIIYINAKNDLDLFFYYFN